MAIASACDAAEIAFEPRSGGDGVPPVEPVIGIRSTPSKRVLLRVCMPPANSAHCVRPNKIDCREISFAAPVV